MNAVLPLLPKSAPSAPPDAAPQREAVEEGETFATVMDRRNPPGRQRVEGGEPHRTEGEVNDTEASGCGSAQEADEAPRLEGSEEVDEAPLPSPLPTLVLPTVPYHLAQEPGFSWPSISGEASPTDGTDETGAADSLDVYSSAAQRPAQNSAAIFAGPSQELPILAAMFPVSMIQLQAQLQIRPDPGARELREGAMHPMPAPGNHVASALKSRGMAAALGIAVPANDLPLPAAAAPIQSEAEAHVVPADQSPTALPQATKDLLRPKPTTERPGFAVLQEASLESADVRPQLGPIAVPPDLEIASRPTRRVAPESAVVDAVLPTHGTPTAKGGEVMHDIPFQAPPKARMARASEGRVVSVGSVETPQPSAAAPASELPAIAVAPTEAQGRRTPDQRLGTAPQAGTRETFSATLQPGTATRAEVEPAHSTRQSATTAAEPAERASSEHQPGAELRIESGSGMPVEFHTARPSVDRMSSEPVSADAPITRAEMVQVVERTADAAVRMRASGNERLEIAVQLESGDHLTIQLRIANGEVTPHFRTSSEGLRTALEQNWAQFSDRASDRGVRMTQPVFDMGQSSSNMTDLSQQRHGRDPGYTDPQAELFPNLPRRMRAPRVISAAPLESASAAPAGVRTYA